MGADSSKDSGEKPWDMPSLSSVHNSFFEPNVPSVHLDPKVVESAFSANQEPGPIFEGANIGRHLQFQEENDLGGGVHDDPTPYINKVETPVQKVLHVQPIQDVQPFHQEEHGEEGGDRRSQRSSLKSDNGANKYAMTKNEHGELVPMLDFHGRPVLFPTDDVMKKKIEECGKLHRFQQRGNTNPMNIEPRESIFYRTSREGLGWKPGGRFDFHESSKDKVKDMQLREQRRSEERQKESLLLHQNEVEFLASRESQRNKAPLDIEYWRMMDEADRAAHRTCQEFRRLAEIEFREMEHAYPEVVRRALEEVNWARAEAQESDLTAGPVVTATFDPRADLHQMEVDLFEWYETFSDVERQDRNINAIRVQRLKAIAMLKAQLTAHPRGGNYWIKGNKGVES